MRNIRGEMNISPSKALPILLQNANDGDRQNLAAYSNYLIKFGRFESIEVVANDEPAPESATAIVDDMKVLIPLGSFIDANAEIQRLNKELQKAEKDIAGLAARLNNKAFIDKAPDAVIEKAQQQMSDAESTLSLIHI